VTLKPGKWALCSASTRSLAACPAKERKGAERKSKGRGERFRAGRGRWRWWRGGRSAKTRGDTSAWYMHRPLGCCVRPELTMDVEAPKHYRPPLCFQDHFFNSMHKLHLRLTLSHSSFSLSLFLSICLLPLFLAHSPPPRPCSSRAASSDPSTSSPGTMPGPSPPPLPPPRAFRPSSARASAAFSCRRTSKRCTTGRALYRHAQRRALFFLLLATLEVLRSAASFLIFVCTFPLRSRPRATNTTLRAHRCSQRWAVGSRRG